jgi:hypothetical protein
MLSSYITLLFLKSFIEKFKSNLKSLWYVVHGEVRESKPPNSRPSRRQNRTEEHRTTCTDQLFRHEKRTSPTKE